MAFLNLFPEKKLARLKKLFPFVSMPELDAASVAFDFLSKRYFGLGFITSFVPGTYAYQARKNLSEKVEAAGKDLLNEKDVPVLEGLSLIGEKKILKKAIAAYLQGPLSLSVFWNVISEILLYLQHDSDQIFSHLKVKEISRRKTSGLASLLEPFSYDDHRIDPLSWMSRQKSESETYRLENMIHLILNPFILINDVLYAVKEWLYLKVEAKPRYVRWPLTKTMNYRDLPESRWMAKLAIAIIFNLFFIPLKIIEALFEIPYLFLKTLILGIGKFAQFLGSAITQSLTEELVVSDLAMTEIPESAIVPQPMVTREEDMLGTEFIIGGTALDSIRDIVGSKDEDIKGEIKEIGHTGSGHTLFRVPKQVVLAFHALEDKVKQSQSSGKNS